MTKNEMSEKIPDGMIPLINGRNAKNGINFSEGETWNDLHTKYKNSPKNGSGVERAKDGVEYWYLPFESHPAINSFNELTVLNREEILSFGFDVDDETITP